MKGILEKIKSLDITVWYIVLACILVLVVIVTILIFVLRRKKGEVVYDKEDFVHKMLTKDNSVKHQLLTALGVGLLVAWGVLFGMGIEPAGMIVLYVFAGVALLAAYFRGDDYFDRVEYNLKALYKHGFLRKSIIIEWKDVQKVGVQGVHKRRKLIFVGKKGKIKVDLAREGSYEFITFCEEKLEGKNFEAIKIAKGRR